MTYLIPAALTAAALVLAFAGNRSARRFRKPRLFKLGASIGAAGLVLLWVLPWLAIRADGGEWAMPIFAAALLVAVSVLGAGLTMLRYAAMSGQDSALDHALQEFSVHNDLP